MEDTLLSVAALLILAKVLEGLAIRLKQNGLVGFVLAGILLGPVAGLVEPTECWVSAVLDSSGSERLG